MKTMLQKTIATTALVLACVMDPVSLAWGAFIPRVPPRVPPIRPVPRPVPEPIRPTPRPPQEPSWRNPKPQEPDKSQPIPVHPVVPLHPTNYAGNNTPADSEAEAASSPATEGNSTGIGIIVGVIGFLALVCGIAGWRRKAGRIAVVVGSGLLVVFLVLLLNAPEGPPKEITQYASQARQVKTVGDKKALISRNPEDADSYFKRGVNDMEMDQYDKAISNFTKCIRLNPEEGATYCHRGASYAELGEHDKAIADYTEAVRLSHKEAHTYFNRGLSYAQLGKHELAINDFNEALRQNHTDSDSFFSRGFSHEKLGKYAYAVFDYTEAIRLNPKDADAHNALAWLYATCKEAKFRDGKKAVEYATRACELTAWKDANQVDTLAAAYAETGAFDNAVKWQKKALVAPDYPADERLKGELRLKLYEQGKPYRDEYKLEAPTKPAAVEWAPTKEPTLSAGTNPAAPKPVPFKEGEKKKIEDGKVERPSPERVARRAMVLALMLYRASLEQFPGQEKFEALHRQLPVWIAKLGLAGELEKEEDAFLRAPLGKANKQAVIDAEWRTEGLGVLLWALNRFDLPPYDEMVSPRKSVSAIGLSDELLTAMATAPALKLFRSAKLRPKSEIDRLATQVTLVNWRLTNYRLAHMAIARRNTNDKGPVTDFKMPFETFLPKHPSFKKAWLQGLRFEKGDLAIGKQAIFDADAEDVRICGSIAVERQTAANWLQGDDEIYSKVSPDTILLGLP